MYIVFYLFITLLTYLLVRQYRQFALKKNILDHPNQRSSHKVPTPRGGGVIITLLWLLIGLIAYSLFDISYEDCFVFFVPCIFIILIGYLDDRYQIKVIWRFATQVVAALLLIYLVYAHPNLVVTKQLSISSASLIYIVLFMAILWSTNLFNFLDGLDGYAAMQALFMFTLTGYIIYSAPNANVNIAYLAWVISALCVGFLLLNWPPAKIFMGDVCSGFLGFIFVVFAYYATTKMQISILLFVYMYGLFWFDATITLFRRVLHGDKWYQSHNLHAYQRLHQAGFSHRQVLLGNIIINFIIAGLILWAYQQPDKLLFVGLIEFILLLVSYLWVENKKPMYSRRNEKI